LGEISTQEFEIEVALGIGEEHPLAMIAALSDVMWASGNDDPSNPWHHG
jgi:hypothetical protein